MKHFSLDIREAMTKGLRPDERAARNEPYLVTCNNMKPTPHGLVPVDTVTFPFSRTAFPTIGALHPQVIRGITDTFLVDATALYTVDDMADPWTYSAQTVYATTSPYASTTITGSGQWHFADFGYTWFMTNGTSLLLRSGASLMTDATLTDKIYCYKTNTVNTLCNLYNKGILLFGGFNAGGTHTLWTTLAPNMVMWSSPGGGESIFQIFSSLMTDDQLQWALRKGGHGYAPCTFQGTVQRVLPLGEDMVVAYGTDGVSLLTRSGSPLNTFGMHKLADHGIDSRSAVGASTDYRRHVYVDHVGYLWEIRADSPVPNRLNYKEYIDDLIAGTVVVSYAEQEQDFYLSNGSTTYVLTPNGLGKTVQYPTSLVTYEGALYGVLPAASGATSVEVATDTVNFGLRGRKFVQSMEAMQTNISSLQLAVDYRYDVTGAFSNGTWKAANPQGWAVIAVAADDFRFKAKGTAAAGAKMEGLRPDYGIVDKRNVRAAYGGRTNAA